MSIGLPQPTQGYDFRNESEARRLLENADSANQKKAQDFVIKNNRLILTSPDGTRWSGTISNAGAVTWTAI